MYQRGALRGPMQRHVALTAAAVTAGMLITGCGDNTSAGTRTSSREASLGEAGLRSALLRPGDVGAGFEAAGQPDALWRYEWSGRETQWQCLHAIGRLGRSPGASVAVSILNNHTTNELVANEVVSFQSVSAAKEAFTQLRGDMTSCRRDRGVELTGSEGVTELRLRTRYTDDPPGDERLDLRAEGRFFQMGDRYPVRWDVTVARTGNHLTSIHVYPFEARSSARLVSNLLRVSLRRIAGVSSGQIPQKNA